MSVERAQAEDAPEFLSGGGEMGALTRAKDWARTTVGTAADWPQSLKTAVSICLGSRHPIVIWWGKEHLTQFYNDAYISFLGATKHPSALGQSARECWREIWPVLDPMLQGVFATGDATWSEDFLFVIDRNLPREEGYFTFSYSPIRDDAGEIGGIFCACTETTARVIGERRLRTLRDLSHSEPQTTAGRASEIAAQTLGKNPADIPFCLVYLVDEQRRLARLAATTGMKAGDSASPAVIDLADGDGRARWPVARVLLTGTSEFVSDLSATFGALPGGLWPESAESALIVPIPAAGQAPPAGVLVCGLSPRRVIDADYRSFVTIIAGHFGTSVANARAYEEERRRAEALAEIDRAKTLFFSNISHEFRTPLTLMLGPLEDACALTYEVPQALRTDIAMAHRNGLRLLKLVNTLLDFSRIEAGRMKAAYEPTELGKFTTDLASNFQAACEKAGIGLNIDCQPSDRLVFVDRDMWEKIVLNIVSNAFKFTFQGAISISLGYGDDAAELRVADTGIGIEKEELPRLFDRFHRIEGARGRTHEGTGIGLALVQELVRLHGGTVSVASEVARGTTFTIRMPLGTAHLPADQIKASASDAAVQGAQFYVQEALRWLPDGDAADSGIERSVLPERGDEPFRAASGSRPTILLADDNADMRHYVARLLGSRYEIEAVADGEAALARIRDRRPDLLLTDVMMPRLSGIDLLRTLRADPALSDLPVVLLSARAGEEASIEGLDLGANDYVVKPFSARGLLARVGANLQMAKLKRDFEARASSDLDAIRHNEAWLVCQSEAFQAAVNGASLETSLGVLIRAAREHAWPDARCAFYIADADRKHLSHVVGMSGSYARAVDGFVIGTDSLSCGLAVATGKPVITPDVSLDARWKPWRWMAEEHGFRGSWSFPVETSSGVSVGTFATYFKEPRAATARDHDIAAMLTHVAAIIISRHQEAAERARSEQALHELTDSLERIVEERTKALQTEAVERHKVEQALQSAQRLEAIGQLTGGLAHDFNNLLTVVLGNAESILFSSRMPESAKTKADAIRRAAERGAQLTNQLLAFARRQHLEPESVAIQPVLSGFSELVRRAVGDATTVQMHQAEGLWPAVVDPLQFESAMLNLAFNARDAMPNGGRLDIRMRNTTLTALQAQVLDLAPGDYVIVSVSDSGHGMNAEVARRCFEPFFTTKDVGKGTGLGLSQVYGFARQSGGTASIGSSPGRGTTVSLYLPRSERNPEEPRDTLRAKLRAGHGETVLVVEDQADVRSLVSESLRELGYRIISAADGIEARRTLEKDRAIKLVLADVVMPNGVSGVDLARAVQKERPEIRVVLMSGYPRDMRRDISDGWAFIQKPFRPADLAATIATALQ